MRPLRRSWRERAGGSWTAARIMPPVSRCSRIRFANCSRRAVSRGAIGSSSSHRSRGAAISRARARRRRWPAESTRTSSDRSGFRSSRSMARAIPASSPPSHWVQKANSSPAVRWDFSPSWWPCRWMAWARASSGSTPSPDASVKDIRPVSGRSSPATARSRLVLPAPFAPVSAAASPAFRARLKPSNSTRCPRLSARPCTSRAAIMGCAARGERGRYRPVHKAGLRHPRPRGTTAAPNGGTGRGTLCVPSACARSRG